MRRLLLEKFVQYIYISFLDIKHMTKIFQIENCQVRAPLRFHLHVEDLLREFNTHTICNTHNSRRLVDSILHDLGQNYHRFNEGRGHYKSRQRTQNNVPCPASRGTIISKFSDCSSTNYCFRRSG